MSAETLSSRQFRRMAARNSFLSAEAADRGYEGEDAENHIAAWEDQAQPEGK